MEQAGQEDAAEGERRPWVPIQDPMEMGQVAVGGLAEDAQRRRRRARAGSEEGSPDEPLGVGKGGLGHAGRKRRQNG